MIYIFKFKSVLIIVIKENEDELKTLFVTVKDKSEKTGLKLSIPKAKILASGPITSWQIDGGKEWKQ